MSTSTLSFAKFCPSKFADRQCFQDRQLSKTMAVWVFDEIPRARVSVDVIWMTGNARGQFGRCEADDAVKFEALFAVNNHYLLSVSSGRISYVLSVGTKYWTTDYSVVISARLAVYNSGPLVIRVGDINAS